MKTYLAVSIAIGAWIALDDGAPLWEVAASAAMGPVAFPLALAFNAYWSVIER